MCQKFETVTTDKKSDYQQSINKSIVTAVLNTGIGCNQWDQFSVFQNMPNKCNRLYQKLHGNISQCTEAIVFESMIEAGKEEANLVIENRDINLNGIPVITIIADGAW